MIKKNALQAVLIIIITAAIAIYIKKNFYQIREALAIKPLFLVLLVLLNMCNKACLGYKAKVILRSFNINLAFKEWFGMAFINNFYNYLAPKSGTAVCGLYLKNKHGLDYHKYVGVLVTTGLVTMLISGVTGMLFSLFSELTGQADNMIFMALFLGMLAGPAALFLSPKIRLPENKYFSKINDFFDGWAVLRRDFKVILMLSVLDLLIILSMAARYYIIFRMFSLDASFIACVLISPFNIITHFATIIPGAYGIKEVAVGAVSTLTNISFGSGVLATLSDRVIMMTLAFIMGPAFSFVLLGHVFEKPLKEVK